MKNKRLNKKLSFEKVTVADLDNQEQLLIKGGGSLECWTEICDTKSDCDCTDGKPYLCPTIAPYPDC